MTPGIYPNVPEAEYRSAEGVAQSSLKLMIPPYTPAHYREALGKVSVPTKDQKIGIFFHSGILEDNFEGYVARPEGMDFTTKEGRAWRAEHPGEVVDVDIRAMVNAAKANPDIAAMLNNSQREVAGWLKHPETGLLLKARADLLTVDANGYTTGVDFKTVGENGSAPENFAKEARKWRYDIQDCQYRYVFGLTFFVFVVVEKVPPFASACYQLSADDQAIAARDWSAALERLAECELRGHWPGREAGIQTLNLPRWKG